jgi:hypothetical protein
MDGLAMSGEHLEPVHHYLLSLIRQGGSNAALARQVIEDDDRTRLGWRYPQPRHRAEATP